MLNLTLPPPIAIASDDAWVGLVVSTSAIVPPNPVPAPAAPPLFLTMPGTAPELGKVQSTLANMSSGGAHAVKVLARRPVCVAHAPCFKRRNTASAAVVMHGVVRDGCRERALELEARRELEELRNVGNRRDLQILGPVRRDHRR